LISDNRRWAERCDYSYIC